MSGSAAPISTARGPNPETTSVVPRSTSNASAWTGPSMYTRCTMLLTLSESGVLAAAVGYLGSYRSGSWKTSMTLVPASRRALCSAPEGMS